MKRLGSALNFIIKGISYSLTVIFAATLALAFLSASITPEKVWWLCLPGLAMPALIIINVILALYWLFRWHLIAIIPILMLVIGYPYINKYFSISILHEYPQTSRNSFKVASYNVRGFRSNDVIDVTRNSGITIDSISAIAKANQIDVLCIQEFLATHSLDEEYINGAFKDYSYRSIRYIRPEGDKIGAALAIYSKYPIVKSELISSNKMLNGAMYADIVIKGDTIRFFNNHLQTNSIDLNDRAFVSSQILDEEIDSVAISKSKDIMRKLKANYIMRQKQVDTLSVDIHGGRYTKIVCGDFNDVPMSYAYNKMKGDLKDCFVERGDGYGYTFNEFMRMLRIDYILCSDNINVITYLSPALPYSDHNPVISFLEVDRPRH